MDHVQIEGHHLAPKLPVTPASRNRVRQRKSEIRSCGDQQLSITLLPRARNVGCCLLCQLPDKATTERGACRQRASKGKVVLRHIPPSKERRERQQTDYLYQFPGNSVQINEKIHNDPLPSFSDVSIEFFYLCLM